MSDSNLSNSCQLTANGLTVKGIQDFDVANRQFIITVTMVAREVLRHTMNEVSQVLRECIHDELNRVIREDVDVRKAIADAVEIAAKELPLDEIVKAVKAAVAEGRK